MDLLTNAIQAIQLGVEDYQAGNHDRLLSAVRNIHAGILLLYKEALRRLSPADSHEVLVKARIIPRLDTEGRVVFVGSGTRTADSREIEERFRGLGITTDWKRFSRVKNARNDIEHYYPQLNQLALNGIISDSFSIIRSFVADELKGDPRKLLGEEAWEAMLEISEVYADEQAACLKQLANVEWESSALRSGVAELACDECGTGLLRPVDDSAPFNEVRLQCRACGATELPESFIPRAIASSLSWALYESQTDGADTPYVPCPECGHETYVFEEHRCAYCGEDAEHTCTSCGSEIPPAELSSSPLCGYCAHVMAKDD